MTSPYMTDWGQYGLADIWDMVRDDNFDNYGNVKAWEKMRVLCHGMADSLRAAAADLAAKWPPEQSPAAAAFKERLERLALAFTQAGDAAGTNGPTLAEVNRGFASTHGKIADMCERWGQLEHDEARRVAITRTTLAAASLLAPYLGTLPVVVGLPDRAVLAVSNTQPAKWLVDREGAPQVATNWRQDLDNEARGVMTARDQEILEARTQITTAPVLEPIKDDIGGGWPPPSGGGGGASGFTGSGFTPPPPRTFPPGLPERSPTLDGPVLDGGALPSEGPGGVPGAGPPGVGPGVGGPGGGPVPIGGGPVPWVMTPNGRALAPGGVIGERTPGPRAPVGAAGAHPGGLMPMGAPPVRPAGSSGAAKGGFVAPPGGLIAGAPQGRGGIPLSGAASARRRRVGEEDGDWVVPAGAPGVLTPDPEPEVHDPGPGVIGIDR
jgi:hypothetical protein